jgi:hypothetical protein
VFASALLVASVLLFVRVSTTSIQLDGSFSGFGFVAPEQEALNQPLEVIALGVSGLTAVQLPDDAQASDSDPTAIRIAVDSATGGNGAHAGSVVLDRIVVPAGTQVWLSRTDVPRQFRISFRSAAPVPITVHADVMGTIAFVPSGARATTATLKAPQPVDFTSTTGTLDLDLTLTPGSPAPRWEQLAARNLKLYRVEDERDAARPFARPVSTVRSGSIYLESIGGTAHALRTGELLRFDGVTGTILTLELQDAGIAVSFQGEASDMRSGAGEHPRSLMPTLLEWLRQRQGVSLLWGTALYLFGITTTLRRWWRKPE